MSLLYDRYETPDEVEYRFHFLPVLYIAMGAVTVLSLVSRGERTNEFLGGFGLFMLAWVAGVWKPMAEIERAMRHDRVEVTGSKFSFSNPMRIMLHKHESLGGVAGGMNARVGLGQAY